MQDKYKFCLLGILGAEPLPGEGFQSFKGELEEPQGLQLLRFQGWLPGWARLQHKGDAGDPRAPSLGTEVEKARDEEADSSFQGIQPL